MMHTGHTSGPSKICPIEIVAYARPAGFHRLLERASIYLMWVLSIQGLVLERRIRWILVLLTFIVLSSVSYIYFRYMSKENIWEPGNRVAEGVYFIPSSCVVYEK